MDLSVFSQLHVSLIEEGRVLSLELNHGKANECGWAQLKELEWLIQGIEEDASLRGLIVYASKVTRSGKSIFVSGANVTERGGWSDEQVFEHVNWQRSLLRRLSALPVFVVMVVDGLALGLGTELLLCADWRIATPRAKFALPETGLGIIPGARGSAQLAALVGPANALYMGMTGASVGVEQALEMGLVNEGTEDQDAGIKRGVEILRQTFTRSPRAVAAYKKVVKGGIGLVSAERDALEAEAYEGLVKGGEAAIGRAHFKDIRAGKTPPWGPR